MPRGRKRYRRVGIKELKRIKCTLSKRRVAGEGERVLGYLLAFHTLAAILMIEITLDYQPNPSTDQFLRPVSPMPASASH